MMGSTHLPEDNRRLDFMHSQLCEMDWVTHRAMQVQAQMSKGEGEGENEGEGEGVGENVSAGAGE